MTAESIAAWAWGALKEPATDMAVQAATSGVSKGSEALTKKARDLWQKVEWSNAELSYRQKLLQLIRTTKILGNPKPIDIDRIYTDVFVFDKLSALRRYSESIDEDHVDVRERLEDRVRVSAEEAIGESSNTFILGRPGAGKTTFLKYLAMSACRGLRPETPIFVSLKDWSDSQLPLLAYVARQFDTCDFPDAETFVVALLKAGKALVLLDGLDEVNEWQDKRNQTIKEIVGFSNKYSKNKFCLTCRSAATDYSFDHFRYLEVADFTADQQEQFAMQWYGKSSEMLTKFLTAWRDPRSAGFRDLGRTPLLLALLCLTFDETLTFPKRQVDVYQEAINALLKKWDTSRLIARDSFYKELSHGQRQQMLETVAADFYFNSRTVFRTSEIAARVENFLKALPDYEGATERVDGSQVVKQIEAQHGLVVERAHDMYSFSHLTVQEYFTASFIAKNQNANLQRQIVKSALNDQKWREVALYTIALLPQADSMLEEMLRQLKVMKGANTGVLVFLGHCYVEALQMPAVRRAALGHSADNVALLAKRIASYVEQVRQPPVTQAELSKFVEHISVLRTFLEVRSDRRSYTLSAGMVESAAKFLKNDPLDAARLLGGYFIKPEQFIGFFYACRLLMECLEVAVTLKRDQYLSEILSLTSKDLERINDVVTGK